MGPPGRPWTGVPQFAQATGEPNYVHNTTVDFGGVQAKFVKLTIKNNWADGTKQAGLSEVRFFYVPVKAFIPSPSSGIRDVALDGVLNWRPGRQAVRHDVYLSSDPDAVAKAPRRSRPSRHTAWPWVLWPLNTAGHTTGRSMRSMTRPLRRPGQGTCGVLPPSGTPWWMTLSPITTRASGSSSVGSMDSVTRDLPSAVYRPLAGNGTGSTVGNTHCSVCRADHDPRRQAVDADGL